MRFQMARSGKLTNQNVCQRPDLDLIGIRGECAVNKLLDLDWSAYNLGYDDGVDMWSGDVSIDVKTGFKNAKILIFKTIDKFRADISVFCRQAHEGIEIVGWCGREEFKKKAKVFDLGHGDTFGVEGKDLNRIECLWKILKQRQMR